MSEQEFIDRLTALFRVHKTNGSITTILAHLLRLFNDVKVLHNDNYKKDTLFNIKRILDGLDGL